MLELKNDDAFPSGNGVAEVGIMTRSSSIFWIGTSNAEIVRARSLLRALTQPGVLDELGFLVLVGAISDRLYPAVNTIMTRARYLVFIPAIYRNIERRNRTKVRAADSLSRDLQFSLRNALHATNPEARGIIGAEAKRAIARLPSNIYWNALGELGIATSRISEASYLEQLSAGARSRDRIKDDDGASMAPDDESFWDEHFSGDNVLSVDGTFPEGTSFDLTRSEAKQLANRYQSLKPDGEQSLLAYLLEIERGLSNTALDFAYPWAVPHLPAALKRVTDHARRLSLFARGVSLQYHAMLFEKRGSSDPGTESAFVNWWAEASDCLRKWDIADFAKLPCVVKAPRVGDVTFLMNWCDAIRGQRSAKTAFHSENARDCLRIRELAVRGPKARLRSKFHLRTWKEPSGYQIDDVYGLTFRHRVGTQLALDITDGLRRS